MSLKQVASTAANSLRVGLASLALFQFTVGASLANAAPPAPQDASNDAKTVTPIKHVIVIIGENRSFDHVFATYVPKPGQTVWNLLSEGIIKADGTPGPNFYKAEQKAATDQTPDAFLLDPPKTSFPEWRPARATGRWARRSGFLHSERRSHHRRCLYAQPATAVRGRDGKRPAAELQRPDPDRRLACTVQDSGHANRKCEFAATGSISVDGQDFLLR